MVNILIHNYEECIKAGWVLKRRKSTEEYSRKWMVLGPNKLTMFNEDDKFDKLIELAACRSVAESPQFDENSFIVYTQHNSILLIATDSEAKDVWIDLISFSINRRFIDPGSTLKEGWVVKKSRYLKVWRPRILEITPTQLNTRKKPEGAVTEHLSLGDLSLEENVKPEAGYTFTFKIIHQGVAFVIATYNKKDKDIWVGLIKLMKFHRT